MRPFVEYRRQIQPAQTDDLQVSKIGLPHRVGSGGLSMEVIDRLEHRIYRAGDQIMGLEQKLNRGCRHKVALLLGEAHCQFLRIQHVRSLINVGIVGAADLSAAISKNRWLRTAFRKHFRT